MPLSESSSQAHSFVAGIWLQGSCFGSYDVEHGDERDCRFFTYAADVRMKLLKSYGAEVASQDADYDPFFN